MSTGTGGTAHGGTSTGGGGDGATSQGSSGGPTLSDQYPGDVGIESDPAVVWVENFEEGTLAALFARYDDSKPDGLSFDADVPAASSGAASGKLTANGAGPNAVDFFKNLSPGYGELFVRYYAKYQADVPWHHTGVWFGGYNPASSWPNPQAGLKPNGDDRFSVSFEPMEQASEPRADFYNYWMDMHSWMQTPSGDTAYYGNTLIHQTAVRVRAEWMCIELHAKLNPDPASAAGAQLGLWIDDQAVIQFTDTAPLGWWIRDKFCPQGADGAECTDYTPASPDWVPLDLRYRSTADLTLNAFWPQNYITDPGEGSVWYDDMVVATERIGCIR